MSLFVDIVEQSQAESNPPLDIQVLGKTLPMELRVVVWSTFDTAAKDTWVPKPMPAPTLESGTHTTHPQGLSGWWCS